MDPQAPNQVKPFVMNLEQEPFIYNELIKLNKYDHKVMKYCEDTLEGFYRKYLKKDSGYEHIPWFIRFDLTEAATKEAASASQLQS